MNWWENEIDGHSLEWQNHESDNSVILHADLEWFAESVKNRFGATVIGISKNPPIGGGAYSSGEDFYAVCFEDGNGNIRWFHIMKEQFLLLTE